MSAKYSLTIIILVLVLITCFVSSALGAWWGFLFFIVMMVLCAGVTSLIDR